LAVRLIPPTQSSVIGVLTPALTGTPAFSLRICQVAEEFAGGLRTNRRGTYRYSTFIVAARGGPGWIIAGRATGLSRHRPADGADAGADGGTCCRLATSQRRYARAGARAKKAACHRPGAGCASACGKTDRKVKHHNPNRYPHCFAPISSTLNPRNPVRFRAGRLIGGQTSVNNLL
jgi:hypothetical protein